MKPTEISAEDIEFINYAYSLVNSARYPSFQRVTEVYNRLTGKRVNNTSCGSCIRSRILELKNILDKFEKSKEKDYNKEDNLNQNENVATEEITNP